MPIKFAQQTSEKYNFIQPVRASSNWNIPVVSTSSIPLSRASFYSGRSLYQAVEVRRQLLPAVRTRASLARSSIVIHVGIPAGQIRSFPVIRFIPGLIRTPARPSMALDHRVAM